MDGEARAKPLTEEEIATQEAAEEAALQAGFDGGDAAEPPAAPDDSSTPTTSATPEDSAGHETPAQEQETPEPTLAELKAEIEKLTAFRSNVEARLQQAFGKVGDINSLVRQLQQTRQASSKPLKLDGGLKRLSAEFPELAKFLQEDLTEVFQGFNGVAGPSSEELGAIMAPRFQETLSEVDQRVERRLLKRDHPDWESVVASRDFAQWKSDVLAPDQATVLDESWDADFIGAKLTEFKAWQEARQAKHKERQRRLEDAITPAASRKDARQEELTEEEAFIAGFNGQ